MSREPPRPLLALALASTSALILSGCRHEHETVDQHAREWLVLAESTSSADADRAKDDDSTKPVPPPPLSDEIFPCSECHEPDDVNMKRRKLTDMHEKIHLHHGPRERWCFDCHSPKTRDKLRLASGRLIDFRKSQLLCGQCHGTKLRDWRAGVHGKRTGSWNGAKRYRLCVHCHNPHHPRFAPLKPKPRPRRPSETK